MFECCTSARMYVNEGRNLDYPNPHVFGCFVHTIADRLSQCTRGGIIKIWYELGDLNKEFIKSPPEYGTGKVIWEQTNSQQTQTLDQEMVSNYMDQLIMVKQLIKVILI